MKKCCHCKIDKETVEFFKDKSTHDGLDPRCKLCSKPDHAKFWRTNSGRYSTLKRVAKTKGLEVTLTKQEFGVIITQPCHYCGNRLNSESTSYFIDRINANKHYTIDNVQPCCGRCNFMKRELSDEEFIKQCIEIADWYRK